MRIGLLAALLILLLPTSLAHVSADPLDVEVEILSDDTDDAYEIYDGFDIQSAFLREAYFDGLGHGVVIRIYLYGGFGAQPIAAELPLEVDITANGEVYTISTSTTDGETWDGDAVIEEGFEPTDSGAGTQGYVQLFVSLEDLGVIRGDLIGPFAVRTYADSDLRDLAPGGRPVPGTNGAVVVPATGFSSLESLLLVGPKGYTRSTISMEDPTVTVSVENLISVIGQHVAVTVDAPGWTLVDADDLATAAEVGEHPTFTFQATSMGTEPAVIAVTTDLGGREELVLNSVAPGATSTDSGNPTPDEGTKGSPSPALFGVLLLALLLRRRQSS